MDGDAACSHRPHDLFPAYRDLGLLDLAAHDVVAARRDLERTQQIDPRNPAVADLARRVAAVP